jgi:NAD-dependent dihydropyrimidine dehydrogenase PreA subunit
MKKSGLIKKVIKKYECSVKGSSLSKSKYLPMLFDIITTENDLAIMSVLPGNSKKVAQELKISEYRAADGLKDIYFRGLIWIKENTLSEPVYCFGDIGLLMDSILFDRNYKKYGDSFYDLWQKYLNEEHIQMYQAEKGFRVLPVEASITKKEVLEGSKIIPAERASEILKRAKKIAVANCACRTRERRCSSPLETCLALDKLAEWEISRGMAREIDLGEALEILRISEEHGLIHETVNSDTPDVICNCCSCCCSFFRTILVFGIDAAAMKSRYMATFDQEKCNACIEKLCTAKCIFGGIKKQKDKLEINPNRCWGCGLCSSVCPNGSIKMKEIRNKDHIPSNQAKFFNHEPMFNSKQLR